jgi:hypothetical protein
LTELLAYVLPKSRELKIEDHSQTEPKATIDYSKLSPELLKELLANTILENEDTQ